MSSKVRRSSKGSSEWGAMAGEVWRGLETGVFAWGFRVGLLDRLVGLAFWLFRIGPGFVTMLRFSLVLGVMVLRIIALKEGVLVPGDTGVQCLRSETVVQICLKGV